MERVRQEAANLEALAEESENEDHVKHGQQNAQNDDDEDEPDPSDSDSDDDGDGGVRKEDPNKFDGLCDGVLDSLALVHSSMGELLELKDILLKHSLPPSVLSKVALSSTKVFRSVSDMHMPVNELIRLVHLYSTPWEEKSAALQKLHEDYESKKNQLNIAVKRLQLIDAHSRRIARERRIMNWEKLFSKMTSERGHGRRWKFLIQTFKNKANEGIESLQSYVEAMEKRDSDDEAEMEDQDIDTQMAQMSPTVSEEQRAKDREEEERERRRERDSDSDSDDEDTEQAEDTQVEAMVPAAKPKEMVEAATEAKPEMENAQVWTHEPEYVRQLHIRVYDPEGLVEKLVQLKGALSYGKKSHKIGPFGQPTSVPTGDEEKEEEQDKGEESPKDSSSGRSGGRLIGTRGGKATSTDPPLVEQAKQQAPRYTEVVFPMPPDQPVGVWKPADDTTSPPPSNIRISVNNADKDELLAMGTMDVQDLKALDFPSVVLPPLPEDADESEERKDPVIDEAFKNLSPMRFPLYSMTSGDTTKPCGQIPLACFWAKTLKPREENKATASESVNDIVFDVTGFDMNVMTKDDLHKELMDECLSAPRFTPEAPLEEEVEKEEQVKKEEYERMQNNHREEMEELTDEYEDRISGMMQQMRHMQDIIEQQAAQHEQLQQVLAAGPRAPTPPRQQSAKSPRVSPHPQQPQRANTVAASVPQPRPRRSTRPPAPPTNSKVWGENMPTDFLERLAVFEQQSAEHQQQLQQKVGREVSERIEKNLAGEFKISNPGEQEIYDAIKDVSLPAVFMPNKSNNMNIYNPRAHNYFHSTGGGGGGVGSSARLTQPPSMVQLPPIPHSKLSVVNLFDLSQNFQRPGGQEWLMQRYLQTQIAKQQEQQQEREDQQQAQQQLDHPVPLIPERNYAAAPAPAAPAQQYSRTGSRGMSGGGAGGGGGEMGRSRQRTAVME